MITSTRASCVVLSWIIGVSAGHGIDRGLVVQIQDSIIADFEAPGLVTGAFLVSNLDTLMRQAAEEVLVPEGWQLITGETQFHLSPHEQEVRIVGARVPSQTPPGEYSLIYRVHDSDHPEVGSQRKLHVVVKSIISLDLSVLDAPKHVEAGSSYSVLFSIRHTGNRIASVELAARSSAGFEVALDSNRVTLLPGDSRQLRVTVLSSRSVLRPVKDRVIVRATAGDAASSAGSQAASVVDVIPTPAKRTERYRQIPSRLTTAYVGGDGRDGLQVEYAGAGFLDERERYRVEYRYRGPQNLEHNAFGFRDEYYMGLSAKNASIAAGDQVFSISNLLERSRLGRGVRADFQSGGVEARAIGFQSRNRFPEYEEYGAFVGARLNRYFNLRGNVLSKKTDTSEHGLVSISSVITPARGWKTDLEYAIGTLDSAAADLPQAVSGRLEGNVNGTRISVQKHIANREFRGYIQDVDQNLVDVYTPLPSGFGLMAAYRGYAQNLEKVETASSAPREQDYRAGIRYRNSALFSASLDLETHTRVDRLRQPDFDNRASFLVGRLQQSFRIFGVIGAVTRGTRKDYLTGETPDLESYRLGIDLSPTKEQRYGVWFQSGHSGYSIDAERSRIVGADLEYNIVRRMRFNASVQASDRNDRSDFESTQFDVGLQYEPLKDHLLKVRLRKQDFDELQLDREASYLISYQIPLGVPIGGNSALGSVRGRVYDADDPDRAGIPGVLLRIGDRTALSDKKGRFAFHSLSPGVHYLQMENAEIGLQRVTMQLMPLELSVHGGKTEDVDLEVVRGGSISGDVAVYGYLDESTERGVLIEEDETLSMESRELIRRYGIADCAVTLTNGEERIHASTDSNGGFTVSKLRPGRWTLSISENALPDYHRLEEKTYELSLRSAQHEFLELRVVPRARRLLIAATGTLRIDQEVPAAHRANRNPIISEAERATERKGDARGGNDRVGEDDGIWFVQVGAYRHASYAERRAKLFHDAGYSTKLVPLDSPSGTAYQLRVGGFGNEESAREAEIALRALCECPTLLIALQQPAIDHIDKFADVLSRQTVESSGNPVLDLPASGNGNWYVQVGAFRNPSNVDRMTGLLEKANLRYKLVPVAAAEDTIMQVRVGGFVTKSDSKSAAARLDSWLEMQTLVIHGESR